MLKILVPLKQHGGGGSLEAHPVILERPSAWGCNCVSIVPTQTNVFNHLREYTQEVCCLKPGKKELQKSKNIQYKIEISKGNSNQM